MGTIDGVISTIQKIKSADIAVYPHRCVAVRNRKATCLRCAHACTSGAISVCSNNLSVDPDKCIGCGTCATMCPTCALEARRPNDLELLSTVRAAAAANDGIAIIACRNIVEAAGKALDTHKVVGVECLGRVDESLLITLAAEGVRHAVLVKGVCQACDHAVGLETAESVTATTNKLLATWNAPLRVEIADKLPSSARASKDPAFDESRRNFFFSAKKEANFIAGIAATEAAREALNLHEPEEPRYLKVMDDGTLPHFIPDRRENLLNSLAALGEPNDELIETRLWGHVMIDASRCTSCRMCATFCPTGAIVKFDEESSMGIDHFPGDCVKCRCCEDICPAGALTLSDEVFAVDLLSGAVERIPMKPPAVSQSNPKKAMFLMRDLLKCDEVFER